MVKRERDIERKRLQRAREREIKRAAAPQSAQEVGTGSWDWRGDGVSGELVREDDARREVAETGGGGVEAEASQWRVEAQRTSRHVGFVEGLGGAAGGGRAVLSREEKQRLRREEIDEKVERRLARQRQEDEEEQHQQQRAAAEEEEEERQEREASREDEEARVFEANMERSAKARRSMKAWVLGALERARHNNLELGGFTEELLLWFLRRWWAEVGGEIRAQGDGPTAARRFFTHLRGQRVSTSFMDGLDRASTNAGSSDDWHRGEQEGNRMGRCRWKEEDTGTNENSRWQGRGDLKGYSRGGAATILRRQEEPPERGGIGSAGRADQTRTGRQRGAWRCRRRRGLTYGSNSRGGRQAVPTQPSV